MGEELPFLARLKVTKGLTRFVPILKWNIGDRTAAPELAWMWQEEPNHLVRSPTPRQTAPGPSLTQSYQSMQGAMRGWNSGT